MCEGGGRGGKRGGRAFYYTYSTLKWACLPNLPEGFCKNSLPHRSQPKYAQFQSVGIKDKLNTRALQLAQLTPPS